MRPRLPRALIIGLIVILLLGSASTVGRPGWLLGLAAPFQGPILSIPLHIQADKNSTVAVPVNFISNGYAIASVVFSVDYDENWLGFNESLPGAIDLNLPPDFVGACDADPADTDGEIDCFIYDPLVPLAALPNGTLATFVLQTGNPVNTIEVRAGFSLDSPPTSFGDTEGQSVGGETVDGSVIIGQGTPFPTDTPTPTITVSPPPTQPPPVYPWGYLPYVIRGVRQGTPQVCEDLIQNSGFENSYAWDLPITVYPADYSTDKARSGDRSMRTGIVDPYYNEGWRISYSSARQRVTIPANADSAVLKFWGYPISADPYRVELAPRIPLGKPFGQDSYYNDFQYFIILDQYLNLIQVLDNSLRDNHTWTYFTFDVSNHIGRTIWVEFGTYNDGDNLKSAMYFDDVYLDYCK